MKQRKICGYDLNGWRDFAARNWLSKPGDETEFGATTLAEGGILTSVVQIGDRNQSRWIGGAEAGIAPHGRGGGWGNVGERSRRKAVRALLEHDATDTAGVAAALRGLARESSCSVVAIDDIPAAREALQENLLRALALTQAAMRLLVWRPVLATLHAVENGIVRENDRVGVICHGANGFSLQDLRIRREDGRFSILAPERRSAGTLVQSGLGYKELCLAAGDQLRRGLPEQAASAIDTLAIVGRLALGVDAPPELMRLANGSWQRITADGRFDLPASDLRSGDLERLSSCRIILFESLAEGHVRSGVRSALESICPAPIADLTPSAVADGALVAAKRFAAREAVYFDFLPRISTIVQGPDGTSSYDLVDAEETLPAGRLYRSKEPARLAVLGGQQRITVYVRKEAQPWPRKSVVDLGGPVLETMPIDLLVEQAPAAGRAKILLHAAQISRQFAVDWESSVEVKQSWESIVESLTSPLPTIPNRLLLPCGMTNWHDSGGSPGMRTLLETYSGGGMVDWDRLQSKLNQRPYGEYCISSDGSLPPEVNRVDVERLSKLTDRAMELVHKMVAGQILANTGPVKFLTWQFKRCPAELLPILLDAWKPGHPLVTNHMSRVLFYQGAGRIVSNAEHERLVFQALLKTPVESWHWRMETACAAFLLSRSETAPLLLEEAEVKRLGQRVLAEFEKNIGTDYSEFYYAPPLLVGLLRWRLKQPRALVASSDAMAKLFADAVDRAIEDISRRFPRRPSMMRTKKILMDTRAELEGAGTNPDLLADIFSKA